MAGREHLINKKEADVERSSEDIRQNIAKEKENITQIIDQIGEQIKDKMDWREYVKDSPYWAIGAAAGIGYLASRVFIRQTSPLERIMDSIAEGVHDSLSGLHVGAAGPGLIKLTLLTIATKTAAGLIKNATSTEMAGGAGSRPQTGRNSTVSPKTNT